MKNYVKNTVCISLLLSPLLMAETVEMNEVQIDESINSVKINDVSGEELKSADLAESLTQTVPSVSLVRRSGIANDIVLRGQKKDNINIIADGTKTYGACPNRMDPATSHIVTNNIESVEVTEGPYDIENFGTLSGAVDIKTKQPTKEFSGELNVNVGSFNYRKASATLSGGNDWFRAMITTSTEQSDQYKDGDGNTFADQIDNYLAPTHPQAYKPEYRDMKAFEKKSLMGKIFMNPTDNQEIRLSYTANRSDNVLYPSSAMDALYDDSDIYNLEYSIHDMGIFSKQLDMQVYHSEVEHPMATSYRNVSRADLSREVISKLTTSVDGARIKNLSEIGDLEMTLGLDASRRNWDGKYYGRSPMPMPAGTDVTGRVSIEDTDTDNIALFAKFFQQFGQLDLELGGRYDDTTIDTAGTLEDRDYSSLNGYLTATYHADDSVEYFVGTGKSSRVPDARELYFKNAMGMLIGTPTLEQTKNYEVDLGVKKQYESGFAKAKIFHSWLKDFIAYNDAKPMYSFENVDATIYGIEVSSFYTLTDTWSFEGGLAYQRGEKDAPLSGQTDTDLAEIPPLKANVALNYDTELTSTKLEIVAADRWKHFDEDNGEQAISGYAIANIKWNRDLENGFDITIGLDNAFNHKYAVSNTYKDLTLLESAGNEVILMNEPGRYFYANLRYRF